MNRIEGARGTVRIDHALIPVFQQQLLPRLQRRCNGHSAARAQPKDGAGAPLADGTVHQLALLVLDTTKESGNEDRDRSNRAISPC